MKDVAVVVAWSITHTITSWIKWSSSTHLGAYRSNTTCTNTSPYPYGSPYRSATAFNPSAGWDRGSHATAPPFTLGHSGHHWDTWAILDSI